MSDQKGLYGKYVVIKVVDGTIIENCFILKPDSDPAAVKALQAYAAATDNKVLAADLFAWVGKPMQKPMTLEETWEKSKEVSDNVIWLEFKEEHEDYLDVIPALISNTAPWPFGMNHLPTKRYFRFLIWPKDIIEVEKEKYGEKHRCWASKPTDEERAAAPWEGAGDADL